MTLALVRTTPEPPRLGLDYGRVPPPEWVAELGRISPRSEQVSWLRLVWEPGTPITVDGVWQGVERWFLYDMLPAAFIKPAMRAELDGPAPSTLNRYDSVTGTLHIETLITERQWQLYRETGCYGKEFWVIQGEHGGHKRFFSKQEEHLLHARGLPTEAPLPGTLPYAPFDQRVVDQIARHDRLRKMDHRLVALRRSAMPDERRRIQRDEEAAWKRELQAWLAEQTGEHAEVVAHYAARMDRSDIPTTTQEETPWQT